jgi:hypothetical protein
MYNRKQLNLDFEEALKELRSSVGKVANAVMKLQVIQNRVMNEDQEPVLKPVPIPQELKDVVPSLLGTTDGITKLGYIAARMFADNPKKIVKELRRLVPKDMLPLVATHLLVQYKAQKTDYNHIDAGEFRPEGGVMGEWTKNSSLLHSIEDQCEQEVRKYFKKELTEKKK